MGLGARRPFDGEDCVACFGSLHPPSHVEEGSPLVGGCVFLAEVEAEAVAG